MKDRQAAAVGVSLAAGVCGAVQPKINAVLGARLGSSLLASLVNFSVAFGFVLVALAVRPTTRRLLLGVRTWPVPRWTLTAGLGGAVIVLAAVMSVQTIGVAVFSVTFFAGQITFGLVVDGLGVGPGGRRPVTAARLQAVLLSVAASGVAQLGRPVGRLAPALVLLVVAAGAAFAFQSAFNGRITRATGDPLAATAVNIAVGGVALACVVGAVALTGHLGPVRWPTQPWLYAGGALGVTIVITLAAATAVLGVLRTTLAMLASQMVAALVVDWTVLGEPPTPGVLAGAFLVVVAVARIGRAAVPASAQAEPEPTPG